MRKAKGRALIEAEEAAAGHGVGCIGGFWDELKRKTGQGSFGRYRRGERGVRRPKHAVGSGLG